MRRLNQVRKQEISTKSTLLLSRNGLEIKEGGGEVMLRRDVLYQY